jgi:Fe-S cluster assembly protein SufB
VGLRSAPEYRYEKLSWESHMEEQDKILSELTGSEYKYGFTTDIETEMIPKGLDEEVVRLISAKKGEPEWMLEYRLKAFRHWKTMTMPR